MSRDAIKVPCTIYGFKRVNNSRYGNPRYRIDTDLGTYTTQSDAALGYEVSNIEHANRAALRSGEGFVAVLTTTRAGRVWDITTYGAAKPDRNSCSQCHAKLDPNTVAMPGRVCMPCWANPSAPTPEWNPS